MNTVWLGVVMTFCGIALLGAGIVEPAVINVPPDAATIQGGIDMAQTGDTVLVHPGTYYENIDFSGKAITVTSSGGPYVTTIFGWGGGSVVMLGSGEGRDSVLSGFTLTNGYNLNGGGVYVNGSPTIVDNVIEANYAEDSGGGIYVDQWAEDPLIEDNIIRYNRAWYRGGGISYEADEGMVRGNLIELNWTSEPGWGGGGVFIGGTQATVRDNTIRENSSETDGGGICIFESAPFILNNMVEHNVAEMKGGGIYVDDPHGTPTMTNNTVYANQADEGGGIYIHDRIVANPVPITNSILWANQASFSPEIGDPGNWAVVTFCDVTGGWAGAGNFSADPLFADTATGDLHLTYDSPCKEAGDNAAPSIPDTDFEGDPRIAEGAVDVGADEFYPHLYHVGALSPGQIADLRVIANPFDQVWLLFDTTVIIPPKWTMYGMLYLPAPLFIDLGLVPGNGYRSFSWTVPPDWQAGDAYYLQALVATQLLTNLDILLVQP
jgi:hypothetical protein